MTYLKKKEDQKAFKILRDLIMKRFYMMIKHY